VFLSRPKGCDKSGHAARIALFESLGPCRFAGWAKGGEVFEWLDFRHVYKSGEPMGKPVTYPFVRVLATEENQTGHVFGAIHYNLAEGPLRDAFAKRDDVGLTRVFLPGGGEIRPSTASSSAKDGGKESFVVFDETHLYILPELKRMYATVRRNAAKRNEAEPWSFETSTMYEPGRNSIAEASHALAKAIAKGETRMPRFLFDHREAPGDTNIDDEESLRAGLREAYGDAATYMDIDRLVGEFWDPRNERADSERYFLNLARSSASAAFDIEAWRAGTRRGNRIADGELITLGFDGSLTDDATALIATHVESGFQWPLGIWERPEYLDGWAVPKHEVSAAVDDAFARFNVWRMLYDPSKWETYGAQWQGRHGDTKVIEWPTVRVRAMALAAKAYAGAIRAGEVTNDGNPRMATHIANAQKVPQSFRDDDGTPLFLIAKDRPMSSRKIDAAMAGCLSWQARLDAVASGALEEKMMSAVFVGSAG
jgi:phage terminase large subunit-like protein